MKDTFVALLNEIPEDTIVYKTMSHFYTAYELKQEMENDSIIARSWGSDLLRISRDMIIRQANK